MVACSSNHCYYGNATLLSLCIVVDLRIAFNNIKLSSIATDMLEWVLFVSGLHVK